jgi:hypothetical protein
MNLFGADLEAAPHPTISLRYKMLTLFLRTLRHLLNAPSR